MLVLENHQTGVFLRFVTHARSIRKTGRSIAAPACSILERRMLVRIHHLKKKSYAPEFPRGSPERVVCSPYKRCQVCCCQISSRGTRLLGVIHASIEELQTNGKMHQFPYVL